MSSLPRESSAPPCARNNSEQRLFDRARQGSRSALGALFTRHSIWLRRWTRGRLPAWARDGTDTSDLVQDALQQTLGRISSFRSAHSAALRLYLRRTIQNRISNHLRRATIGLSARGPSEQVRLTEEAAPQFRQLLDSETWECYLDGLEQLTPRHRRLVVGRLEFGYSYRQLALIERLSTPDAARMAYRRALVRLSRVMPKLSRRAS